MRTVEWQNIGFSFEEESYPSAEDTSRDRERMSEENDKQAYQIKKYQDPSKDLKRQELLALTESFGTLLANNIPEKIAIDLLTEDFEGFVFSSTGRTPVQHNTRPQGFIDLCAGKTILERNVRVSGVDSEKNTAWQICDYKIIYEDNDNPIVEVACEIFTIKENRISKYRASFGCPVPSMSEFERFLMPSRKDKMLAKVKEINYALAGQPDVEKITSLFNENTEFRIWRWGDHKCFTLNKDNFSSGFGIIEEDMEIKSIVPLEISVDTQQKFISGTYVYHLEERCTENKFVWFSTCIYGFDPEVNLTKISQQGELYPEEEADIPIELYSRDALVNMSSEFAKSFDQEYNPFYNDSMLYDCRFYAFMPESFPNPGYYQGLKHIDKLEQIMKMMKTIEFAPLDVVDVFVDHYNESHEIVLILSYVEGRYKHSNEEENGISITIFNFENGKLAKQLDFISRISYPIPSPFDDKTFQSKTIQLP